MDIFIMRHGIAEDVSSSGEDRDRALTPEGRQKTRATARKLAEWKVALDVVVTSPYRRTRETAEIMAETLGCKLVEEPALASGESSSKLFQRLQNMAAFDSVLLVGHEPDLSRLISILISGGIQVHVTMKKGGLCRLYCTTIAPGRSTLEWMLSPKHFF